jgi:hypothetical protein
LEEDDILETKVCVDLYDHDLVGSDDFMGQAVVDISSLNLLNELTYSEWFMLQQQVRCANIIISKALLKLLQSLSVLCCIERKEKPNGWFQRPSSYTNC